MKPGTIGLILWLSSLILSGCGGSASVEAAAASDSPAAAADANNPAGHQPGENFSSAYLKEDYANALSTPMQLALGTMQLEGSANAITAAQAGKLLLFWQSLQGDALQNPTEINAVYKQIEATMTPEQMQAIVALQLTRQNLQDWAQRQGLQLPDFFQGQALSPAAEATRRAEFANLSPEAQATQQAQFGNHAPGQAGQGDHGGQGAQAANQNHAPGQRGPGGRGARFLLEPLVKLLTERAGQ